MYFLKMESSNKSKEGWKNKKKRSERERWLRGGYSKHETKG
jgi:hypothetical protein